MNKEKLLYEAPTALTFEVKSQGCMCASPWSSASIQSMEEEDDDLLF